MHVRGLQTRLLISSAHLPDPSHLPADIMKERDNVLHAAREVGPWCC